MTLKNDLKRLNIAFIRLFRKIGEILYFNKLNFYLTSKIVTFSSFEADEYNKTYIELKFAKKVGLYFILVGIGFGILLTTI